MIYKVWSWAHPGCQCTLSNKSFSLYFSILYVVLWVIYLQMYLCASGGRSGEVPLSRRTRTKEASWLLHAGLLDSKAEG